MQSLIGCICRLSGKPLKRQTMEGLLVLLFQKQFYDFRVKVRAGMMDDIVHRFVVGHGFAVGAVGGHRIPNISHSEDARGQRDRCSF